MTPILTAPPLRRKVQIFRNGDTCPVHVHPRKVSQSVYHCDIIEQFADICTLARELH